ncbi:shikimate kinase [Phytoactinopolyspora alkaliphila]|uniref:Shikimate kinase n=1 Tax=Phytoactinopolyspora alkaliphila TaxID=1783498 RepID=A0A6N9YRB9_9ACTN|nr:shikimate kinase [Phytoactinopolyspora alkaliphila]
MSPRLVLVGPPGAGKSSVGRRLARHLGVELRDTDADIERTAGKSITDIFIDDGEPAFRELERAAVAAALAEHEGVLALGGGAVGHAETRAALRGHTVVFLDVGLADAVGRVGLNRDRPLLLDSPRAQLKRLLDERRPLYEEVASVTVVTTGRSIDEVVQEVILHV